MAVGYLKLVRGPGLYYLSGYLINS